MAVASINAWQFAALCCATPILGVVVYLVVLHVVQSRREQARLDDYVREVREAQDEAIERGLVRWRDGRAGMRRISGRRIA